MNISSEACLEQFILEYSSRLTTGTLEGYQTSVVQLLAYSGKSFEQITRKDIRNWLAYMDKNRYKVGTIKNRLMQVNQFYKYCVEEEFMSTNPVASISMPGVVDTLPYYLEMEQLTQLRLLVQNKKEERAVIEVFYATGVRLSELVAMKKEDVDWTERLIRIPRGKRKKARIVLFTRECAEHLEAYLNTRSDNLPYLFVSIRRKREKPFSRGGIQYWFKSYRKELGIRLSPHTLRHTFAAHLAKKGCLLFVYKPYWATQSMSRHSCMPAYMPMRGKKYTMS